MDDKPKEQSFVERVFSGSAIATILIALVGQSILSIVYQIVNNEQQAAQITANLVAVKNLESNVYNLSTPLSNRVFKLEDRFEAAERRHDELGKRVDQIDTAGTRALGLVTANQQRVMGQLDRLGERQIMMDRKLGDIDSKSITTMQNRVEAMEQNIKRIETLIERLHPLRTVPP